MKPRAVLHTTVAILLLGFAAVAGAQPDQKAADEGNGKHADKGQQQGRQQQQPQAHAQQRTRPNAPPVVDRRGQVRRPVPPRSRMGQRMRSRAPAQRAPQGRAMTPSNRIQPPSRNVMSLPAPSRSGWTGAQQRAVWPRYRAQSWNTQHRTWSQRGGYDGYRIPSTQFSLYFGRPHRFHLSHYRVRIVDSHPQFYANGFWFTILDPVPEYWRDDWYDSDDVTVIYGQDGYYLVNEAYPDAQISISVRL